MNTNSRHGAFASTTSKPHPANLKLTWSNTDNTFKVYDKSTKSTSLATLPLKFMVIDNYSTITGWNEKTSTSFYSNEIKNINAEQLVVKDGTGTVLAGKYNDIKDTLNSMGAKYGESIYVLFQNGTIGNIILNGSNVAEWFKFKTESKGEITKQWIGMANPQKHKKGSIVWSTPEIRLIGALTDSDSEKADNVYDIIQEYKTPTPSETTIGGNTLDERKSFLEATRPTMESTEDDGLALGY